MAVTGTLQKARNMEVNAGYINGRDGMGRVIGDVVDPSRIRTPERDNRSQKQIHRDHVVIGVVRRMPTTKGTENGMTQP